MRGEETDDVPVLVKITLKALKLHPEALAPTAPAGEAVKRSLGSLASMGRGVAGLRNKIGTGHGRGVTFKLTPDTHTWLQVRRPRLPGYCSKR